MKNDTQFIQDLCQNGYAVIDAFLEQPDYLMLIAYAQSLMASDQFKHAGIGQQADYQLNKQVRSDKIIWLDMNHESVAVKYVLNQLEALMTLLNQQLFLSLIQYEAHFALYHPGDFYQKHRDQFQGDQSRQISCVYYLNEAWAKADGGELVLYDTDGKIITSILPESNRFVCFQSHLEHEVLVTQKTRLSITAWLKQRSVGLLV